jgi:hypothetical protein
MGFHEYLLEKHAVDMKHRQVMEDIDAHRTSPKLNQPLTLGSGANAGENPALSPMRQVDGRVFFACGLLCQVQNRSLWFPPGLDHITHSGETQDPTSLAKGISRIRPTSTGVPAVRRQPS